MSIAFNNFKTPNLYSLYLYNIRVALRQIGAFFLYTIFFSVLPSNLVPIYIKIMCTKFYVDIKYNFIVIYVLNATNKVISNILSNVLVRQSSSLSPNIYIMMI